MKQTSAFLVAVLCLLTFNSNAQITGTVYRDYNGNGTRQTVSPNNETGVKGVTITAYNTSNQVVNTTTSGSDGSYTLAYTVPVRLEFQIPTGTGCVNTTYDFNSFQGDGNSVRFVTSSPSTQNYAINNPSDYVATTNPYVFANRFSNGNPLGGGNSGTSNWIIGYPYNTSGSGAAPKTLNGVTVGSTWGLAYSKQSKKIFAAAFLKRHAGLGTLSSGGIYMFDTSAAGFNAPTAFFNMDDAASIILGSGRTRADTSAAPALGYGSTRSYTFSGNTSVTYNGAVDPASGFAKGLGVIGTNADRALPPAKATLNYDPAAFDQVGKVGLGDLDISDNGKFLFVTNLYDRKIYRLELNSASNPTSVIAVTSYTLPAIVVTNGVLRPFGLKFFRGKLFVGAVSTGENGGVNNVGGTTDMYSYVFELNSATGSATFTSTPVLTVPLNYAKGPAMAWTTPDYGLKWYPWSNNTTNTVGSGTDRTYPTPILSDIEFDERGDMILAFMDRGGHQWSESNYYNLRTDGTLMKYAVGGDLLIAGNNCNATFTIENNGAYTSSNGVSYNSGAANNEGPGNSEFFKGDKFSNVHSETTLGSLAYLPGTKEVFMTTMDPLAINTGGTKRVSLTDGVTEAGNYQINGAGVPEFGKANGLGDVELTGVEPPIEIGNRIWKDSNENGIQDATEPGLANVTVQLYTNGANLTAGDGDDVLIGTAVTTASGNYYFSSASGTDGSGVDYGVSISPNTNYNIRIGSADWTGGEGIADLSGYTITLLDQVSGGLLDVADNDAAFNASTVPMISITTGNYGENNHSFDFGFRLGSIGDKVWLDTDKDGTQDAGETGVSGVTVTLYNSSNVVIATTKTDAAGNYLFGNLPVSAAGTNYQVKFELPAQYQFTTQSGGVTVTDNSDANSNTGRTTNASLTTLVPDVTFVDAGLIPTLPARIGDFIWYDTNADGVQDAGEQGISGVTITLYDNAGNPLRTTVTDNNGHYEFTDVTPGTYTLGITPPVSYVLTTKDQGGDDTKDSDFDPTTFKNTSFVVTSGTDNLTFDGGLVRQSVTLASLGDKVWYDIDADGIQDAGETGVQGVTVQLYNSANTLLSTVTTDVFGNYIFNGLAAGNYYVKFSNIPAGYALTTANVGSDDYVDADVDNTNGSGTTKTYKLVAGQSNVSVDAGITSPASTYSIGDKVWYDIDKDGIQDVGESGVPGVLVMLYNSSSLPIDSATTDLTGNYLFTGLASGTYSLGFTALPKGYGFTAVNADVAGIAGANNSDVNPFTGRTATVTVNGGNANPRYIDAGIIASPVQSQDTKASLGDKVWNDLNNDGLQTAGEPGIAGVVVTLYAANGTTVLATDTTDALGNYLFTNLDGGNYVVGFATFPSGYTLVTQDAGTDDTKDSDPNAGTGKTGVILLQPGQANLTIDAGLHATAKSALGDKVWYDIDSDGIQDAGEAGVPGVTVTLFDGTGAFIKSTATDNAGNYLFTDLNAGSYIIGFSNLPAGFTPTTKDASGFTAANGSDADAATLLTGTITLAAATTDLNWDMGIVAAAGLGAIGDYVWYDADGDGIQDATELPTSGILVTLYDNSNVAIATAVTDGSGFYFFPNLPVSVGGINYTVGFSNLPANSTFTTKGAGTATNNSDVNIATGKTDVITLTTANPVRTDIDAGIVSNFAAVGNYVWYDVNNNGLQGATEVGVAGDLVTLYNAGTNGAIGGGDDFIVSSAITNGNGGYFINNIPVTACTNFYMQFGVVPGATVFTLKDADVAGINGASNSDANVSGQTIIFSLCPEQVNPNIDAGLFPPSGIILPVQKLDLSANLVGTTSTVNWTTENEINAAKFIVERSTDNISFTFVGEKQAQGNFVGTTKYQLNDNVTAITANVIYYRIKAIDINGKVAYSKVVIVRKSLSTEVKAWPNPFTDRISISLQSATAGKVTITLMDNAGKLVKANGYNVVKGNNQLNIDRLKALTEGVYILKVTDASEKNILIQKITKN